jgi:AcrR family transcriptional regulator
MEKISATKHRILDAALHLFNTRGVAQVTVRDIAAHLGMSHGNLCYHYPNTGTLVEALYYRLVSEMDTAVEASLQQAAESGIDLDFAYAQMQIAFSGLQRYKFLMLNFADVMRAHPALRAHYRALTQARKDQFNVLLNALEVGGWLTPERYKNQRAAWVEQAALIGDFWIASAEILSDDTPEEQLAHYLRLFILSLKPLMGDKGLDWAEKLGC